jgi:hypothetical protein
MIIWSESEPSRPLQPPVLVWRALCKTARSHAMRGLCPEQFTSHNSRKLTLQFPSERFRLRVLFRRLRRNGPRRPTVGSHPAPRERVPILLLHQRRWLVALGVGGSPDAPGTLVGTAPPGARVNVHDLRRCSRERRDARKQRTMQRRLPLLSRGGRLETTHGARRCATLGGHCAAPQLKHLRLKNKSASLCPAFP